MKILSIDYGTKRIGIAVSRASLAEPLTILDNGPKKEDRTRIIEEIKQICDQENVEQIVVGMSENHMAEKIRGFTKALEKEIDLPVDFFDETLSSKIVQQKMLSAGIKQKKRRGPIDHYAAALILEEWMEMNL